MELVPADPGNQLTPLTPKSAQKRKRPVLTEDVLWGAWFFYRTYFEPVYTAHSVKAEAHQEEASQFHALDLSVFTSQYALKNTYMWSFKEHPENCLSGSQLHAYVSGRLLDENEPFDFPYSAAAGFARCHKLQGKNYRGLKNPMCIAGVRLVSRMPTPGSIPEHDAKRWEQLSGHSIYEPLPEDADAYTGWRKRSEEGVPYPNGSQLMLTAPKPLALEAPRAAKKPRPAAAPVKTEKAPPVTESWKSQVAGVLMECSGPVTAAKSLYEDEQGFLVRMSVPFVDRSSIRVRWRNTGRACVITLSGTSVGGDTELQRGGRTFRLSDPLPELCRNGTFQRQVVLPTQISVGSEPKATFDPTTAAIEINVPRLPPSREENEVPLTIVSRKP